MKKSFATLTTMILILLMVFSFHPQVVFADGETPTAEETSTVKETPPPEETETVSETEQSDSGDLTSDAEATPEEELAEETEPVSTPETNEVTPDPPASPEATVESVDEEDNSATEQSELPEETSAPSVSEVLEQAPEGTQLVILDNQGNAEPLASQEAADIVASGDPMWCPGSTPPGGVGCTTSYTTFDALITELGLGAYTGDGTIYVADGYNSGLEPGDISIDGTVLTNLGALSIQGGWDGITGGATANIVGTSTFGVSLEVVNWGGQVTINDVIFSGTNFGLAIDTSGAVSLDNVQVSNTTFNNGIGIQAGGDVSLNNVDSSSNSENGVDISTTNGNINITNSTFNNNGGLDTLSNTAYGMGLNVETLSNGNIFVSNVTATGNAEGGAYFGAPGSVTLANSIFDNNNFFTNTASGDVFGGSGLEVNSGTSINLSNVSADSNYLFGADLTAGTTLSIIDSTFSNNDVFTPHGFAEGFGLDATANGNVSLTNVTANGNYLFGAGITSTTGTFNLQTGNFSTNQTDSGLYASSSGLLTLNMVTASNNGSSGAVLDSNANVEISNSTFNNNSGPIYAAGVEVTSPGTVTMSDVTANANQDDGIAISTNSNVYLNNIFADSNGWDGAYVDGQCTTVYVTNGSYTNNGFLIGGFGLEVDNSLISSSGSPFFSNNFLGDIAEHLDPCFIVVPQPPEVDTPEIVGNTTTILSGQLVSLSCDNPINTLVTPRDVHVTFKNLCGYQVFVIDESEGDLNSRLPILSAPYRGGVTITLLQDGIEIDTLPVGSEIVLSFPISDEEMDQEFAIQYWDGTQWIELDGIAIGFERVEVLTKYIGTFVLGIKE
jgi:hypothetical protein